MTTRLAAIAIALLFLGTVRLCSGCSSDDDVLRAVEGQGFSDVRREDNTLRSMVACGDDLFVQRFSATNQAGKRVHGFVCCGVLKACTVRF